jgi:hypothetical protein
VDNSFDQFRLVHPGHRFVAAFEFVAAQMIAIAQRRNRRFGDRRAAM